MLKKISLLNRYEYVEIAIADQKNNPMAQVERDITDYLTDLGIQMETDPCYSPKRQPRRKIILLKEINGDAVVKTDS